MYCFDAFEYPLRHVEEAKTLHRFPPPHVYMVLLDYIFEVLYAPQAVVEQLTEAMKASR